MSHPDEDDLKKNCDQVRHRMADMRTRQGESPYQPMPDAIRLSYPEPAYSKAISILIQAEDDKSPNPSVSPTPKRKHSPRR